MHTTMACEFLFLASSKHRKQDNTGMYSRNMTHYVLSFIILDNNNTVVPISQRGY